MADDVDLQAGPIVPTGPDLLKLWVDPDLSLAFHRCLWIIVHETGRTPVEIMNEMVRDFLVSHGC